MPFSTKKVGFNWNLAARCLFEHCSTALLANCVRLFDSFILAPHVFSVQLHLVCLWAEPPLGQSAPSDSGKTNDFQALSLVKLCCVLLLWEIWLLWQQVEPARPRVSTSTCGTDPLSHTCPGPTVDRSERGLNEAQHIRGHSFNTGPQVSLIQTHEVPIRY